MNAALNARCFQFQHPIALTRGNICYGLEFLTMIRRERPRRNTLARLLYTRTCVPSTPTTGKVIAHNLSALAMARQDDLGVRAARRVVGDGLAGVGNPRLGRVAVVQVVEHGRVLD